MDLTPVAAAVEPGALETFVDETQGRSSDEMSAAALVPSSSPDVRAGLPHRERLLATIWNEGRRGDITRVLPTDETASWPAKAGA